MVYRIIRKAITGANLQDGDGFSARFHRGEQQV
jgi:hypothetical protein